MFPWLDQLRALIQWLDPFKALTQWLGQFRALIQAVGVYANIQMCSQNRCGEFICITLETFDFADFNLKGYTNDASWHLTKNIYISTDIDLPISLVSCCRMTEIDSISEVTMLWEYLKCVNI